MKIIIIVLIFSFSQNYILAVGSETTKPPTFVKGSLAVLSEVIQGVITNTERQRAVRADHRFYSNERREFKKKCENSEELIQRIMKFDSIILSLKEQGGENTNNLESYYSALLSRVEEYSQYYNINIEMPELGKDFDYNACKSNLSENVCATRGFVTVSGAQALSLCYILNSQNFYITEKYVDLLKDERVDDTPKDLFQKIREIFMNKDRSKSAIKN